MIEPCEASVAGLPGKLMAMEPRRRVVPTKARLSGSRVRVFFF